MRHLSHSSVRAAGPRARPSRAPSPPGRQRGVTFIGWLVLLTPLAIFGYAGLQLWPLYYNYMRVAHTLEQVATEFKAGADASPSSMRNSIEKHFEIDMVESPTPKDIKITKQGRGWILEAQYEGSAPLFANLSMKVDFDKVVRVGAAGDD